MKYNKIRNLRRRIRFLGKIRDVSRVKREQLSVTTGYVPRIVLSAGRLPIAFSIRLKTVSIPNYFPTLPALKSERTHVDNFPERRRCRSKTRVTNDGISGFSNRRDHVACTWFFNGNDRISAFGSVEFWRKTSARVRLPHEPTTAD